MVQGNNKTNVLKNSKMRRSRSKKQKNKNTYQRLTIHVDVSIENNGRMFIHFDYSILPKLLFFFTPSLLPSAVPVYALIQKFESHKVGKRV